MKKFLSRNRKSGALDPSAQGSSAGMDTSNIHDLYPVNSGGGNRSTYTSESQDSFGDLQPMFTQEDRATGGDSRVGESNISGTPFVNDTNLNLNPSISITKYSVFTKDSEYMGGKSIFSKGKQTSSYSTKPSTAPSTALTGDSSGSGSGRKGLRYGLPLQILDIPEESHGVEIDLQLTIQEKLHVLSEDCSYTVNQFNNSVSNLTTTVINIIDCLKRFVAFIHSANERPDYKSTEWSYDTYNNVDTRRLMVVYLNLYDNLLKDDAYLKLKLLLTKNFNDFISTLSSANVKRKNSSVSERSGAYVLQKPQNYAVGINGTMRLPNESVVHSIMDKMASSPVSIKEQSGSFIAPILRGLGTNMNVMCLYFAYPSPTEYHYKLAKSLHDLYDEIHIMVVKNKIEMAASSGPGPAISSSRNLESATSSKPSFLPQQMSAESGKLIPSTSFIPQVNYTARFKLPFRVPSDITKPPMSMSISLESTARVSGTVGGYIYPMINVQTQPHLQSYAKSKFAVSCGHVCLDSNGSSNSETTQYPHVSVPSKVLILLYKQALVTQYQKISNIAPEDEQVPQMEAKIAYSQVIKQVDQMFPPKRIKMIDPKTKQKKYEMANLPIHRFGQIIWGERTLIDVAEKAHSKRLSDLAVIKVNRNLTCDANFLGEDISFNEFDPSLMFDNLYVRDIVSLSRSNMPQLEGLDINEIDDETPVDGLGSRPFDGINVFKYGSTSKFTRGNLNGIKLVFWLDGAIQSSEFVVNSIENNSAFAAGGDSGLWVLTKCEDCPPGSLRESKGLAVLGMLHSYDGEFKQFGLFLPMTEILSRLQQITSIKWGVVGVSPTKKEMIEMGLDYVDEDDDLESISGAASMGTSDID